MKKYSFIYLTTNNINLKQYVGYHSADTLDDNYIGSGKLFLKAVNKYGTGNFSREILKDCENILDAVKLEEEFIIKYNTIQPFGYNISPTGGHGLNGRMSEDTKRKISEGNAGKIRTPVMKKKYSESGKGVQAGKKHGMYGKHHTQESINKISESRKGKTSGEDHHYFGKTRDEKTKQKIRESLRGRETPDEVKKKLSASSKNVKKVICEHCNKEFTPWGLKHHTKALIKRGYINKLN